jgi:HSP20 family molecular chaperone IbpA
MFKKKIKCICGNKIDLRYEYCPHCGTSIKEAKAQRDLKKLHEDRVDEEIDKITKELSRGFGMPAIASFPFKMFVKKLSKDIEKQFREMDQEMSKMQRNQQVPLNSKKVSQPLFQEGKKVGDIQEFKFPGGQGFSVQINMGSPQESLQENEKPEKVKLPKSNISERKAQELSKLPRQEPETKIRRLTDKIVYEISLPGVKNEKDIIINKLQNSIEIKAFSKDKAYFKLITLALAIKSWKLDKEVLVLELKI